MTKLYFLLAICFLASTDMIHAQKKAKFKNDACTVQKTRLPQHFSEAEQRTYDLELKGQYVGDLEAYGKKIFGWTKDQDNPNMKAVVSIYGFSIGSPQKHSEKKEKKNKEGKVTESWTEYWYTGSATGKGTLYVYGHNNPFEYNTKVRKKSKWEEKQEAKAKAEKKDLNDNPFLSADVIAEAEESDIGADEGLEGANLELVDRYGIDQSKSVTSGKHRTSSAAYSDYTKNKRPTLVSFRNAYPRDSYKRALNSLNYRYGFAPVNNRFYLKRMKTDDHPSYKMWNDACQATETIFKTFKYNESIDENQKQFDPIVEYFVKETKKISEDDKKARKHKKAAYQNLLNLLFYLDRHDDVIAWSEKYLESKNLDNVAKGMLEKSERQKAHLAFHNMETCHFETSDEVDEDDIETEELVADEDDENGGA